MNKLFCLGYGYVAQRLVAKHLPRGWKVLGSSRNPSKKATIPLYGFDGQTPFNLSLLQNCTHLLISIPPSNGQDVVLTHFQKDLLSLSSLKWIGYLSSTTVYGNHHGEWVTEESPLLLSNTRNQARQAVEAQWLELSHCHRLPVHIFRLSGIYGPGRSVLDAIQQGNGQRIYKKDHTFSRIHVDDIGQTLWRSLTAPQPGNIYNIADDLPASSAHVMTYGYKLLDKAPPPLIPFNEAILSPMAQEFYADHKKVSNLKIKKNLGVSLFYPTYREGLRSCLQEMQE